jgi:heat shock protein HslJ
MRRATLLAGAILFAALLGCAAPTGSQPGSGPLPTGDSSRTSLDWTGVYSGTVPCADCPGIRTRIELREDGTFTRSLLYLGEDERPRTDTGRFAWDDSGSRITLGEGQIAQQFQVGENLLFQLDRSGQRITGNLAAAYRLEKTVNDPRIENRRWQLIELNGRRIEPPSDRDGAYFELDATEARVAGNASCNRFFGTYELTAGDRIRFGSDIGSTMMACPELEQEREFLDMLGRVDNYSLGEGGLSLNRARMAPLARFREAPLSGRD